MSKTKSTLRQQLSSLFFPIHKVNIAEYTKHVTGKSLPFKFNKNLDHWIIAETVEGDELVVNACSKNYGLLSNEDLMDPLIKALEKENYNVEAHVFKTDYTKFYTDFVIKDKSIPIKKDMIFPRIRMNNSYDGSVKYQFSFGFYRLVCENGMTAPVKGLQSRSIKLRHTPLNTAGAIDKTMAAIKIFLDQAPEIAKGYDELTKRSLSWEKAMELIEEVIDNTKFPKKQHEAALARLKYEHEQLKLPINDYLVYNALNYALYKNPTQMKIHKRDKVDAQVLKFITEA